MSASIARAGLALSVALAGAVGLSACNDSATTVQSTTSTSSTSSSGTSDAPTSPSTSSSSTDSSSTDSTSSESSTTDSTSTSSESPSTGSTSSTSSATESSAPTDSGSAAGAKSGTFTFGQSVTIKNDKQTFEVAPTSLQVAPDSAYADANLKRANGTVYYMKYKVKAVNTGGEFFAVNSVNGLFLHPHIDASRTGKRMYGDLRGCSTPNQTLSNGQSGEGCYIYQVTGPTVRSVSYTGYPYQFLWQ